MAEQRALFAKLARVRRYTADPSYLFVFSMLFSCLFLQRFGVPFGSEKLNIVGPLGLAFVAYGLISGVLAFHAQRLKLFLAFLAWIAIGACYNSFGEVPYNATMSMPSIVQFVGITAFTVVVFAKPMNELRFFNIVSKFLLVIAIFGIIQFFAQFVGIKIFAFADYLPHSIVAEALWNVQIPIGIGELLKSNGFFLVEPSVASQLMAIGLIIEFLYQRRTLYFALLLLELTLAFSGTGEIVLAGFLLIVGFRLGGRGLLIAFLVIVVFAVLATAVSFIEPSMIDMAQARLGEFSTPGTSGHMRFVTPFWLLQDVLDRYPDVSIFGMGGGTSERLTMPYNYDVNTPIKIALEYGFPALLLYASLFVVGKRTVRQSVLVLPMLLLLMVTGAYQQFAPIIYFATLLICTARLQPVPVEAVRRLPTASMERMA